MSHASTLVVVKRLGSSQNWTYLLSGPPQEVCQSPIYLSLGKDLEEMLHRDGWRIYQGWLHSCSELRTRYISSLYDWLPQIPFHGETLTDIHPLLNKKVMLMLNQKDQETHCYFILSEALFSCLSSFCPRISLPHVRRVTNLSTLTVSSIKILIYLFLRMTVSCSCSC